jgi:hypothetical protein
MRKNIKECQTMRGKFNETLLSNSNFHNHCNLISISFISIRSRDKPKWDEYRSRTSRAPHTPPPRVYSDNRYDSYSSRER